jgi:hypothetical protein
LFVGTGLVVASAGVAVGLGVIAKQNAQDAANSEYQEIASKHYACDPPRPATAPGLPAACATLHNDYDQVNQDATIGNIAIGVGAAALVGTIVYWIAAKKRGAGPPPEASGSSFTIVPLAGPRLGALSISGSF